MGSESGKALADLLHIARVRSEGEYVPKIGHKVLNWGMGKSPNWAERAAMRGVTILNKPMAVGTASNKLSALQALKNAGVRVPEFTTDMIVAQRWLTNYDVVVERHELRGNSGDGIRIVTLDDEEMESTITRAPLYTKFIPKTAEFRVHVFRGEVIDYIEKKKVLAERRNETFNKYVSSITCGWVFSRTDVRDLPDVRQLALRAVAALGLDFGAVDIVYADGLCYVLEVNTAPGLAGTTLVKYGNAVCKFMGQPDLPAHITAPLLVNERPQVTTQPARPIAATIRAEDVNNTMHEIVNVRITRADAQRLATLLGQALR